MPNDKEIIKNTEEYAKAAQLFAEMDILAKEDPSTFAFFCKKYEQVLYDNFDWAFALFHGLDVEKGIIEKFLPYMGIVFNIIVLIVNILILSKFKK